MASIQKHHASPFWQASFMGADGKWKTRTTKTTDREQAQTIADAWAEAAKRGRNGRLDPDRAREIIGRAMEEISAASGRPMAAMTLGQWLKEWTRRKDVEVSMSTSMSYRSRLKAARPFFAASMEWDLTRFTAEHAIAFRSWLVRQGYSPAFTNSMLATFRDIFGAAHQSELVTRNVFKAAKMVPAGERVRRPFTREEVGAMLAVADQEWRGAILMGLWTGQSIGDCLSLTIGQVDLNRGTVKIRRQKTGRHNEIPLRAELMDYFMGLPSSDDPNTPVFPRLSRLDTRRSHAFRNEILSRVGIVGSRVDEKGTRRVEATFHSLRHTLNSWLQTAGGSRSVAQAILGQQSEAVNQVYTHTGIEEMRTALSKVPGLAP